MALTEIQQVRLKTSDQPTLHREASEGDGATTAFKLEFDTILGDPIVKVWKDSVPLVDGVDYTVNYQYGYITLAVAPLPNEELVFEYSAVIYTDEEIEQFLSDAGGNTSYAAALNLFAWAANAAKVAKKETLAGGAGYGQVTLDLAVRAAELRKTAQVYLDLYDATEGSQAPADGLTEVPWTEHMQRRLYEQELIRE